MEQRREIMGNLRNVHRNLLDFVLLTEHAYTHTHTRTPAHRKKQLSLNYIYFDEMNMPDNSKRLLKWKICI